MEFGDRMKMRMRRSGETRILLRLIVYCLKILVRCYMDEFLDAFSPKSLYV